MKNRMPLLCLLFLVWTSLVTSSPIYSYNRPARPKVISSPNEKTIGAVWNVMPGIQGFAQQASDSEKEFGAIKAMAERLADSDSAIIKPPVFRFRSETKQIEYNLGGVRLEALELQSGDPYLIVFEKEIKGEAWRKLFRREIPGENFCQPILAYSNGTESLTIQAIEGM